MGAAALAEFDGAGGSGLGSRPPYALIRRLALEFYRYLAAEGDYSHATNLRQRWWIFANLVDADGTEENKLEQKYVDMNTGTTTIIDIVDFEI